MCWYQQRPKRMQTDPNRVNLCGKKYENKAVLIASNNCLHFFSCDNYYLGALLVPSNVLTFNHWQQIRQEMRLIRFTVEKTKAWWGKAVLPLYRSQEDFPSMKWSLFDIYNRSNRKNSAGWWALPRDLYRKPSKKPRAMKGQHLLWCDPWVWIGMCRN